VVGKGVGGVEQGGVDLRVGVYGVVEEAELFGDVVDVGVGAQVLAACGDLE
jgi:hypothetical protein